MTLYDDHHNTINVDLMLMPEDSDRKGIEACLRGCDKCTCNHCSLNLIVLDAFFDYFIENLQIRGLPPGLIQAYQHVHNGQRAVHCLYNGGYPIVQQDIRAAPLHN